MLELTWEGKYDKDGRKAALFVGHVGEITGAHKIAEKCERE